ncbi:MAG: LemA family protein, partial [Patescibacteria group bacterium]|nr:LemA family protein [Patescibacteria group bacterium]
MIWLWIVLGIIVLIILWLVAVYNGIITLKNRTQEAWSDIDVQLKRRYDLIPNLVESVKGYAKHEKDLLTDLTKARTAAMEAKTTAEKAEKENVLSQTLKSLFAVAENYPNLKASENFLQLQNELTDTEDKIEAARRFYNGNVRDFNIKIQVFPNNMIARQLGFKEFDLFATKAEDKS